MGQGESGTKAWVASHWVKFSQVVKILVVGHVRYRSIFELTLKFTKDYLQCGMAVAVPCLIAPQGWQ
jgi:hypothetical protein